MSHYTYLLVLIFTLSYPLYKSFEDKVSYSKKWKFLWPALLISAAIFIPWDIYFTAKGVWSFDRDHTIGLYIAGLPLEEWCFFFIIPFACMFIYEVMNYFVKRDVLGKSARYISATLILLSFTGAGIFHDRHYTLITLLLLGSVILLMQFILKASWMGRYYLTWAVCTLPFLLVNGVLTTFVVSYNNPYILNVRIWNIPLEDFFYGMLNILIVTSVYEYVKKKQHA